MPYTPALHRRMGYPVAPSPHGLTGTLDRARQAFLRELNACLQAAPADAMLEIEGTLSAMDQLRHLARKAV